MEPFGRPLGLYAATGGGNLSAWHLRLEANTDPDVETAGGDGYLSVICPLHVEEKTDLDAAAATGEGDLDLSAWRVRWQEKTYLDATGEGDRSAWLARVKEKTDLEVATKINFLQTTFFQTPRERACIEFERKNKAENPCRMAGHRNSASYKYHNA